MSIIFSLLLLFYGLGFSAEIEELGKFFSRQGYVVEKLQDSVVIDLGKGNSFKGERFRVIKEGKELIHPVTGEVIGKRDVEVGEIEIEEVKEKFSVAKVLSDEGIERGSKVKLSVKDVCYQGSEEGYFKVSSLIGSVKKGKDCMYVVREFRNGYGVEFKGSAIAFFERPAPQVVTDIKTQEKKKPEKFKLEANFVLSLPSLPLSADVCTFSEGRSYLAVLFEGKLTLYELLEKEPIELTSMNLPAGYPVSVQCARLKEDKDLMLVNMVSGTGMSSMIVDMVGGTPVILQKEIPFFLSVLDKSRARESFIGQSFDGRDLWGETFHMKLAGNEVLKGEKFKAPSGFRADSAVMKGDLLMFTDSDGYLRLYKKDDLLLSEENFGGSYVSVELPGYYEDDEKYIFNTPHFLVNIEGETYLGAVKNVRSPVYRFLNVTKFSEGELYVVVIDENDIATLKKLNGKKFEEAIQSVLRREDKLLVITGRTGTLPLQNRGDIYEVRVKAF